MDWNGGRVDGRSLRRPPLAQCYGAAAYGCSASGHRQQSETSVTELQNLERERAWAEYTEAEWAFSLLLTQLELVADRRSGALGRLFATFPELKGKPQSANPGDLVRLNAEKGR